MEVIFMKKFTLVVMIAAAVFCLSSCASAVVEEPTPIAATQVLGKDGVPQPEWVVKDVSTQDVHFGAGYGKAANYQNSIKKAEVEGRNVLAEWVKTSVDEVILNYSNDAGEGENRQAIDAFETLSKQNASAMLSGSKREALWVDADGGVWVLMSIPVENVKDQMVGLSEAVNEQFFEENEAAANANQKMNEAFNKYFGL